MCVWLCVCVFVCVCLCLCLCCVCLCLFITNSRAVWRVIVTNSAPKYAVCLRFTQINFIKLAAASRRLFVQKIPAHRHLHFTTTFHKIPLIIFEVKNIQLDGSFFTIISHVASKVITPACTYMITATEIRENYNNSGYISSSNGGILNLYMRSWRPWTVEVDKSRSTAQRFRTEVSSFNWTQCFTYGLLSCFICQFLRIFTWVTFCCSFLIRRLVNNTFIPN